MTIRVEKLLRGYLFAYTDFRGEVKSIEAVIKALNRMVSTGKISKHSRGKYFKPKKSAVGELATPQYRVVIDLLEKGGKVIGNLTGYLFYSMLGLISQIVI